MKNNSILLIVIALIVGGAAGFFGGIKYQQKKLTGITGNDLGTGRFPGGLRAGRSNGGQGTFRPTTGKIVSFDDKSITVELQDGSTKIVLLSDKTQINKAEKATKNDLREGTQVAIFGMTNSDGSVTAQNIQLNPQLAGAGRRQPNQNSKSSDAKEIVIEGSNYKFTPNQITVKKGVKTRILFKNTGGMHDFRVDELNLATSVIQDGQQDFVEFTPNKTGTFEFYCSVGNHRQMGMVGKITVE